SLIALGVLSIIVGLSIAVVPLLRARINRQFLLGARNQAFLTEYVAGMETVKSLQMEPRLESRYDELLATYLSAGFSTRQLSNTYNTVANALEQVMTLAILCIGALLVMRNDGFTIGMHVAADAAPSRPVAGVPAGLDRRQAPGRHHGRARRAVCARAFAQRRGQGRDPRHRRL